MEIRPVRVLLVDDDEDIFIITEGLLSEIPGQKFQLDWVATYKEGLEGMCKGEHEVYLLDYRLGEHNGLEMLREALTRGFHAPAILLTGQNDREVDLEAMKAGAADFLVKGQINAPMLERSIRYSLERARTLEALRESEERYVLAVRGANDGLWDWDLKTDRIYYSPRWKAMLGCEEGAIASNPDEWFNRVHPEDLEQLRADIDAHLNGLTPHFEHEHRMLHRDGSYRWMLTRGLAVRDSSGKAYRMAGSQSDISVRKAAEEQLMHGAFHDALTGLPNRKFFIEGLRRVMARAKRREGYLFAVLFLDLDRFKIVNDSLGHMIGDELLIAIARRLESCLRPADTVARLGGDEFTVLLDDIRDTSDATRVAERIQRELVVPLNLSGHEVYTTASIGITLGNPSYIEPDDIIRDADTAMYRAKALGKARYEMFDAGMHAKAVALLNLEADLRKAVEHEEFVLLYQPMIALETNRITGFETLVRWKHPERGLIPPSEFMPIAEETGLIVPIGWAMLEAACRQVRDWQIRFATDPPVAVSVNLSKKQFAQADLVTRLERILLDTQLAVDSLILEITENVMMENADTLGALLSRLKALRIQVHVDDFGTGYSSMSYLNRFPVDTLKIDQSFISGLSDNGSTSGVVETIVSLAHNLGIGVLAEGVETVEQLVRLKSLKCEFGQGFYFYRPMDVEAAEALLAAMQKH